MALSTQDILLVKRKVFNYLKGGTRGDVFAFQAIDQLFRYFSQHGANPDLQAVFFSDLSADTVIADAACKVYAIYLKKQNTATGAFFKARDHASATSGTADDMVRELNAAGERVVMIDPLGWAQGTGFTVASDTTADGTTSTTSGDGPDGFVIIGAA